MEKYSEEVVGLEGLSKAVDLLKEVPIQFRDEIVRKAFGDALRKVVKPGLVSATPYDTITAGRKGKRKTYAKNKFIIVTHGKNLKGIEYNPTQMVIGFSQAVYPLRYIEYGTVARFTKSYDNRALKSPAEKEYINKKSFVREFYQSVFSRLEEYLKTQLANEIDKIIKKKLRG